MPCWQYLSCYMLLIILPVAAPKDRCVALMSFAVCSARNTTYWYDADSYHCRRVSQYVSQPECHEEQHDIVVGHHNTCSWMSHVCKDISAKVLANTRCLSSCAIKTLNGMIGLGCVAQLRAVLSRLGWSMPQLWENGRGSWRKRSGPRWQRWQSR